MSLFDKTEDIIQKLPFERIFSQVNIFIPFKNTSSLALFFKGKDINNINLFPTETQDDINTLKELRKISFDFTEALFHNNSDDSFWFNPLSGAQSQFSDLLKTVTNRPFDIDSQCYSIYTNIHPVFELMLWQYNVEKQFKVPGFDQPEKVYYIHIIFNNCIHWFYPIQYIFIS